MNHVHMAAFRDELEKIGASWIQNLGTAIKSGPRVLMSPGGALRTAPARTWGATVDTLTSPMQTMRAGWKETWNPKGGGMGNKLLFAGGTALQGATVAPQNDPTGRNESRLTRGARFVGGTLGGIAGMKRGVIPSIALGIAGDVAGGAMGNKIDKLRGAKKKPKAGAPSAVMPQRVAGPVAAIPEVSP